MENGKQNYQFSFEDAQLSDVHFLPRFQILHTAIEFNLSTLDTASRRRMADELAALAVTGAHVHVTIEPASENTEPTMNPECFTSYTVSEGKEPVPVITPDHFTQASPKLGIRTFNRLGGAYSRGSDFLGDYFVTDETGQVVGLDARSLSKLINDQRLKSVPDIGEGTIAYLKKLHARLWSGKIPRRPT